MWIFILIKFNLIKIKFRLIYAAQRHDKKEFWVRVEDGDHSNAKKFIAITDYEIIELLNDIIFYKKTIN